MKHDIIKTENYLLIVDNSEIKEGSWYLTFTNNVVMGKPRRCEDSSYNFTHCKKIIAHLPLNESPILEGVDLLPPLEQEDNVEQLALEDFKDYDDGFVSYKDRTDGFINGYNKAKEKSQKEIDKQISDFKHDLRECTDNFVKQNCEGAIFGLMRLKQSLSQPNMPIEFECKMYWWDNEGCGNWIIDTTTNPQGQTVWVGKYIY